MLNSNIEHKTTVPRTLEILGDTLTGVLDWNNLDRIWGFIKHAHKEDWFLYTPEIPKPEKVSTASEVSALVDYLKVYLPETHERKYCGIVYVDSLLSPTIVRIFDPKELTSMCNISGNIPAPSWVITTQSLEKINQRNEAPVKFQHKDMGGNLPPVDQHPQAVAVLDARKMGCPLPLVNTARSLRGIKVGELLQVVSFEPSAVNDIGSICEFTGHKHAAQTTSVFGYSFYIERMHMLKRLPDDEDVVAET